MTKAEVTFEIGSTEPISYKRGNALVTLTGFNAWLYRGMIGMYGKEEATERFWWHWHKKAVFVPQHNTAQSL